MDNAHIRKIAEAWTRLNSAPEALKKHNDDFWAWERLSTANRRSEDEVARNENRNAEHVDGEIRDGVAISVTKEPVETRAVCLGMKLAGDPGKAGGADERERIVAA